jgi:hypothetical protein
MSVDDIKTVTCFHCRRPIAGRLQWQQAVRLSQGTVHLDCFKATRLACDAEYVRAVQEGRHPRPAVEQRR